MSIALAVLFALAAVGTGVYGLGALLANLSFALRCEETEGTVVEQRAVGKTASAMRTESGMSYQPTVRFVDRQGRDVDFHSPIGYYPPRHRPGQTVTIQYDPRNPGHAVILGDNSLARPTGFVILGLFFGLVAAVLFLVP